MNKLKIKNILKVQNNLNLKIFNSLRSKGVVKISDSIILKIKAGSADDDIAELMLYDDIGKNPWDGSGITAKDFKTAMDQCKGRPLDVRINSLGGDVFEGIAIKTMLDNHPKNVRCFIDGIAASTASFIPMGADEIIMSAGSQMFIHDAWGICQGNAADMEKVSEQLDQTSDLIAGMYAERTGRGTRTMRGMMQEETLMNAAQCKELGLCDSISEKSAVRNFTPEEISGMKNKLHALANNSAGKNPAGKQTNKQQDQNMNRQQMLALLKTHGILPPENETDAQIIARCEALKPAAPAAPIVPAPANAAAEIDALKKQVEGLTKVNDEARRQRITARVEKFISDDVLPGAIKDEVIAQAMKDETALDIYAKMPAKPPGAENLKVSTLEIPHGGQVDGKNLAEHFMNLGPRFSAHFLGPQNADRDLTIQDRRMFASNAKQRTADYRKNRAQLISMYDGMLTAKNSTNTIDSNLQRIVLLQEMLEEYVIMIEPLTAFSVVFNNIPLEGLDTVGVPFYPLQATASSSWAANTGYTFGNTTTNIRQVKIGGPGGGGTGAAANQAYDRLFQGMQFDSYTLRRQPFFNAAKLCRQNANKLAVDLFAQVITRVITPTNYGNAVDTSPASAFSSSDIANLYGVATGAQWPMSDRALVLDHTYNVSLLQDPTFKSYLAYGSTDPLWQAKIKQAYGFDRIIIVPNLIGYFQANAWGGPANNNVAGWINHLYAMLFATSPIMPAPEVRTLLTRYDVIADDKSGAAFEYREMANAQLDQAQYVVESSFGASLGVASSLSRITSAGS